MAYLGDNPMQSELSSHIGMRGKYFCRICDVKGNDAEDGGKNKRKKKVSKANTTMPGSNDETTSDVDSVMSTVSDGDSDASDASQVQPSPSKKGRRRETSRQMFERVVRFMKVSLLTIRTSIV